MKGGQTAAIPLFLLGFLAGGCRTSSKPLTEERSEKSKTARSPARTGSAKLTTADKRFLEKMEADLTDPRPEYRSTTLDKLGIIRVSK